MKFVNEEKFENIQIIKQIKMENNCLKRKFQSHLGHGYWVVS